LKIYFIFRSNYLFK